MTKPKPVEDGMHNPDGADKTGDKGNGVLMKPAGAALNRKEGGIRLALAEIREKIVDSQVIELGIAMAVTGLELRINPDTMKMEEMPAFTEEGNPLINEDGSPRSKELDQKERVNLIKSFMSKMIANPPAITESTNNDNAKWAKLIAEEAPEETEK